MAKQGRSTRCTMVEAINLGLREALDSDPSVVLMGEDIGKNGGVFRVTEGLQQSFGVDRVIDSPLAESALVGAGIGMALAGLKPVIEIQFSGFAFVGFAQLEGNGVRYRARSQGHWTVPMVIRMPYGGGVRALEHHSESRESTFASLTGLKVLMPSTPRNARALTIAAINDPDPVVVMEPKHAYRSFREAVPEEMEVYELGKADIRRPGRAATVITWGAMTRQVDPVLESLAQDGIDVEHIDLLTISPMDIDAIAASVQKTGRAIVVQEATRSFSAGSEIVARINERAFYYLEAPVNLVSSYDVITPYFGREHLYLPNAPQIEAAIRHTLAQ